MTFADAVTAIKKDHPSFEVKSYLENWWFRLLWRIGWRMGATTVYTTVFMAPHLLGTSSGAEVLRHEKVHIDDCVKQPFWFFFSYFFLPPIGPGMRAYWEWRGYQEDLKESCERLCRVDPWVVEWVVGQFTGPNYLWMYPFKKKMTKKCADFSNAYLKTFLASP